MSDKPKNYPMFFDTVARLYDEVRPPYPPLLAEDVVLFSQIKPDAFILDIGCGTGKSTEPFAKLGYQVCALDPGSNMLAACAERLRSYPSVTCENAAFADWQDGGRRFDLIVAANPFHWLAETGTHNPLRVAKPGGAIAIFWHTFFNGQGPFYDCLDDIYREHAPELCETDLQAKLELADREKEERLLMWDGLSGRRVVRYYDQVQYDAERYLGLLRTWPNHASLPDSFFNAITSAIKGVVRF